MGEEGEKPVRSNDMRPIPLIPAALAALVSLAALSTSAAALEPGQDVGAIKGQDETGQQRSLDQHQGKVVVLVFWGSECPTSKRYAERLRELTNQWGNKVVFLGVASNGSDQPDKVKGAKAQQKLEFPILLDKGGEIAKRLGVGTTPIAVVIDAQGKLRYRGQIDDDPKGEKGKNAEAHLKTAVQAVVDGKEPARKTTDQTGTRIKP